MISVLLDSSSTKLNVGLAKDDEVIDSVSYEAWQQQSEYMVYELDKLLKKHHFNRTDIVDILVCVGPGSYTGVRIALTIAKVMSLALSIPIYPLSSLHVIKDDDKPSICLINARSNRSYIGVYRNEKVIVLDTIFKNDDVLKYIDEHKDYSICGDVKYLGLNGVESNIFKQMLSLKNFVKPMNDTLGLKPIYMKD